MAYQDIQYPTFQPAYRVIASITNGFPAIVTTNLKHQYITGLIARLYIPRGFGMQQANRKKGIVTRIDDTSFSIELDTTYFDPFVIPPNQDPPDSQRQYATVVPVGEVSSMLFEATQNVLPYPLIPPLIPPL